MLSQWFIERWSHPLSDDNWGLGRPSLAGPGWYLPSVMLLGGPGPGWCNYIVTYLQPCSICRHFITLNINNIPNHGNFSSTCEQTGLKCLLLERNRGFEKIAQRIRCLFAFNWRLVCYIDVSWHAYVNWIIIFTVTRKWICSLKKRFEN